MLDKLAELEKRYEELTRRLSDPEVIGDPQELEKTARAHGAGARGAGVPELRRVEEELGSGAMWEEQLEPELVSWPDELGLKAGRGCGAAAPLLLKTPTTTEHHRRNPGRHGGEEAVVAADLFHVLRVEAAAGGWSSLRPPLELGASGNHFMIHGKGVQPPGYGRRAPGGRCRDGAQGRIHVHGHRGGAAGGGGSGRGISPEDLRIDVFRSGGKGGQSVNTTDSAVRITHLPTGIVVTCQDERSQLQNREKAMRVLRARLLDMKRRAREEELAAARRSQVGTGDRSERIRTYNFPQGRVTDHRIGLTLYKLNEFLDGDLDEAIDALAAAEQAEQLAQMEAGR